METAFVGLLTNGNLKGYVYVGIVGKMIMVNKPRKENCKTPNKCKGCRKMLESLKRGLEDCKAGRVSRIDMESL